MSTYGLNVEPCSDQEMNSLTHPPFVAYIQKRPANLQKRVSKFPSISRAHFAVMFAQRLGGKTPSKHSDLFQEQTTPEVVKADICQAASGELLLIYFTFLSVAVMGDTHG